MPEKEVWIYVIAILTLVLTALLRYGDKVSEANLMQIFTFILGTIFGGVSSYAYARRKK